MKKSILIFILLLGLLTIPACNKKTDENADKPVKVSIINLIANPKEYDGKRSKCAVLWKSSMKAAGFI